MKEQYKYKNEQNDNIFEKICIDDMYDKNTEIVCYREIIKALKALDKLFKKRNRHEDERNIPLNLLEIQKYEFFEKNAEDIICRIATSHAVSMKAKEKEYEKLAQSRQ
jgi:hypothetical protein